MTDYQFNQILIQFVIFLLTISALIYVLVKVNKGDWK